MVGFVTTSNFKMEEVYEETEDDRKRRRWSELLVGGDRGKVVQREREERYICEVALEGT